MSIKSSELFALPLSWEYDEQGGYDCMYSGYHILDRDGTRVFTIDGKDFGQESCQYGPVPKAEQVAAWICDSANARQTALFDVSDRLPDDVGYSVDYLVFLANGDKLVAAWMNIGGWDFDPESQITHWMPIPDSPNKRI